jgi:hypothetical protein
MGNVVAGGILERPYERQGGVSIEGQSRDAHVQRREQETEEEEQKSERHPRPLPAEQQGNKGERGDGARGDRAAQYVNESIDLASEDYFQAATRQ